MINLFKLSKTIGGVFFDVNFIDRINIIKGASGTGKTYLFNTIASYCTSNKISYAFIDYKFSASGDEDLIFSHCINKELIILDNADLYLTKELFDKIRDLDATIILSKKTTFGLNMSDAYLYTIDYTNSSLVTKRLQ